MTKQIRRRARLGAAAALAALLAIGAGAAAAADIGAYKGGGTTGTSKMPAFEAWKGSAVPRALDFFPQDTWSNMLSTGTWAAKSWGSWSNWRWKVSWGMPMLPNDGVSTLAKGATGAYNSQWKQIGAMLVSTGHADAILRLGWEFNGNWFVWSAVKCPTCFVQYWQQIVTTLRSVPGQKFKFDWNPGIGSLSINADKVYPGDAYVDYIGLDVYNEWWDPKDQDPVHRWNTAVTRPYGLAWQASFAAQHGKMISFPEWATGTRPNGHGAGDDPYFIQQMYSWIQTHNVRYHDYWDYKASDYNGMLSNNQFPKAGAMYQQLFGPLY
ncbi:MAG: glycosyl hydrolase [Dongiaceae bacterium]